MSENSIAGNQKEEGPAELKGTRNKIGSSWIKDRLVKMRYG